MSGFSPARAFSATPPTTRPRRSRSFESLAFFAILVLVAAGIAVYLATSFLIAHTGFRLESPRKILNATVSAGLSAGSVTISVRSSLSDGQTLVGAQKATLHTGSEQARFGNAQLQNLCVPGVCYLEGNQVGLEAGFGMTRRNASAASGKWISLPASLTTARVRGMYDQVFTDTTLTSYLANLKHTRHLEKLGATTFHGQEVVKIGGTMLEATTKVTAHTVAYILTTAPHTLVYYRLGHGQGNEYVTTVETLSDWGTTPVQKPPASSVPVSTFFSSTG